MSDDVTKQVVAEQPADTSTRPIPALNVERMQLVPGVERPRKTVAYKANEVDWLAVDEIVELLCEGQTLTTICSYVAHLPTLHMVLKWRQADSKVEAALAQAQETAADVMADSTVLIADTDYDPTRAAIRIKARQWLAERRKPQSYGNKVSLDINANINAEQQRAAGIERARSMRDQLAGWASQVIEGQVEKDEQPND